LLQLADDLLLRQHAQLDHFACLRHVVGELLVAARQRFLQRRFDGLQAFIEAAGGVAERLHRAAERFALVAMAGELAISFGILPLPTGAARDAMLGLFEVWRAGRGQGPSEDRQILRAIADFIARHGDTRFSSADDPEGEARDRAGYWEDSPTGRLYLFNRPGLEEAAKGYDLGRVVLALESVGAIAKREPGRAQATKRLPSGRKEKLYWIDAARLEPEQ